MTELDLQQYIRANYPKEDEGCEWKEFKTMKNAFSGDAGNDVVSYASALANMEGGHLVMGVEDKTLEIIGIDNYNYKNFAKILVNNPDLSLTDIMLLDKVQKQQPITEDALQMLRKKKFVEGHKASLHLSAKVVAASKHVGLQTAYILNSGFDDDYYKRLILEYLKKFGKASRQDINLLLTTKLPDVLNEKQKNSKIGNLLTSLRKDGQIENTQGKTWQLKS